MTVLTSVVRDVATVVAVMLTVTTLLVVGPERLRALPGRLRSRGRRSLRHFAVLGGVLVVNSVLRDVGPRISWVVGWNVTGLIYAAEGSVVGAIQGAAPELLVVYLSFVYVYGYVYLLVFPIVAYLALDDPAPIRTLTLSYALNYGIGLACYLAFVAYGPRNLLPGVESLLYVNWPGAKVLVSEVNTNTNVFPSLHTSLSATVALLAYRTREEYPFWTVIAAVGVVSVALSTMVLGIHWLTDVVFGLVLGVGSVHLAELIESHASEERPPASATT